MQKKNKEQLSGEDIEKILDFSMRTNKLKLVQRYSELKKHNKEFWGDYSAGHSWRLAMLVLLFSDTLGKDLDLKRMLEVAIVHDLAEVITDDIDAILVDDGVVSKESKRKEEIKALDELLKELPEALRIKITKIWEDYEYAQSKEARFVKVFDKIEAQTHILSQNLDDKYDVPNFTMRYADKPLKKCPRLKVVMDIVKKKLKDDFDRHNIKYKK